MTARGYLRRDQPSMFEYFKALDCLDYVTIMMQMYKDNELALYKDKLWKYKKKKAKEIKELQKENDQLLETVFI